MCVDATLEKLKVGPHLNRQADEASKKVGGPHEEHSVAGDALRFRLWPRNNGAAISDFYIRRG